MNAELLTIADAAQGLATRAFSARELTQTYLKRCKGRTALRAFLAFDPEGALAAADRADAKIAAGEASTLTGIPFAVKDNIVVKGLPATAASKILEGYMPPYTATAVERLQELGAIALGKTNCDEFAMGASGEQSAYGAAKNPWDQGRVPGGSSSGSVVAVADGQALFALGSDTGGSVRQPAGFTRVVGMKPTYGAVSRYGLMALASSFDVIGPIARTVRDAATVYAAMRGKDPRDATSHAGGPVDLAALRAPTVSGLTIGVPKEYFGDGMDPEVRTAVDHAMQQLRRHGATLVDVSLPSTRYAVATYYLILASEASANLARYDGVRFGKRADASDLLSLYRETREAGFGDEVKLRIMLGTFALSSGYHDAYYGKAQRVRTLIREEFEAVFTSVDALLTPTSPTLPFKLGERVDDPLKMYLADIDTVTANIAGLPALSLPCGPTDTLPVGCQLLAPANAEMTLFRIAAALEDALGFPLRLPEP